MELLSAKALFVLVTIIMSLNGKVISSKGFRLFAALANVDGVIKETFDHKFHIQVIKKSI